MAVTAAMVKELREMTGAGMMDCKNVLVEVDGDLEKAIEVLREKGLANAAKKAGRVASEGLVRIEFSPDGKKSAIVEVNSETDFVAKNEEFIEFVETLAGVALGTGADDLEGLLATDFTGGKCVQDILNEKISKIGENLNIRRFAKSAGENLIHIGYIHGGGKIGVIIGFETEATKDEIAVMGKDIAMQVASMNPKFIDESQIDPAYLEEERKILIQQAINEGKPANIVEKMVEGRLKKELKEVCLLEQKFVKDSDITVAQYIDGLAKEIGKDIKVASMIRYEVGEGIEKKEEDFAAEVAKQMDN